MLYIKKAFNLLSFLSNSMLEIYLWSEALREAKLIMALCRLDNILWEIPTIISDFSIKNSSNLPSNSFFLLVYSESAG